ncbi:carboxypeptidase-like regulatory domain-containing protein [Roseitranquillus sediminis]|uniref:carboxypeptidase-like regulatory domain-containing protein n=1 Tax=Roseitranquillus sediminis TaxID=2809051 RepID=UPI002223B27D|nr:carboxypeptidase-like regulatory domain-containing protein [Roseitranquillus sediminis]MBM9596265.1 carboxypeptidase regulatory-like domain-containing protein [Roseitranquillus sediminis]
MRYSDTRAPIPLTSVQACPTSGGCRETTTDTQGAFMFRDLPPGTYEVRAPESSVARAERVTVGAGRSTVTIFGN